MNNQFLDSIAAFGKFGIENSGRTRDEKEWAKSGVDCLSSILKLMQAPPKQNMLVMGLSFEQIKAIKQVAAQYSIEKAVLFPYPNGQNIVPLIRVYSGDSDSFFQTLGWTRLQSNAQLGFSLECDSLEKEYGIIIYESI